MYKEFRCWICLDFPKTIILEFASRINSASGLMVYFPLGSLYPIIEHPVFFLKSRSLIVFFEIVSNNLSVEISSKLISDLPTIDKLSTNSKIPGTTYLEPLILL